MSAGGRPWTMRTCGPRPRVLTLPMNHLTYTGTDADGEKVAGTDPLSLLVFDGQGKVVLEAREVLLAKNVNTCTFVPAALAQEVALEVAAGPDGAVVQRGAGGDLGGLVGRVPALQQYGGGHE